MIHTVTTNIMKRTLLIAAAAILSVWTATAQEIEYKFPPQEVVDIIMAKPLPAVIFNADYTKAAVTQGDCEYSTLERLSDGELRIGGIRINANNFSPTREKFATSIYLTDIPSGKKTEIAGLPQNPEIRNVSWSPSGKYLCFTNSTHDEVELWRVDVSLAQPTAGKINEYKVNSIFGDPYKFLDDEHIIYKSVPQTATAPAACLPTGPVVQENLGSKKALRTYQDLLKSPYDIKLYDYCCTSVFAVTDGNTTSTVGEPAIYRSYSLSPDRKYMIATTEHHPYSYAEGHNSFPSKTFIMSTDGDFVKMLKDGTVKDKKDKKDKKDEAKKPSRSQWNWRADKGAVLTWIETAPEPKADKKEAKKDEEKKDKEKSERTFFQKLCQCEAPFNFETDKAVVLAPEFRIGQIVWGNDNLAIFTESSSKQKIRRASTFVPGDTVAAKKVLITESTDIDSLGNFPVYGRPWTVNNAYGRKVLYTDKRNSEILLYGERRDKEGDEMAFLDKMTLKNGKIQNLWTRKAPFKEEVIAMTDFAKLKFISKKQAVDMVPNYFLVDVKKGSSKQITYFEDPVPSMQKIQRQFVSYKRADGLTLTAILYLPEGYDKERDGKLPLLLWGYPSEFQCAAEAEKERPDRYAFVKPSYSNFICWATQGYAVMQGASMPILSASRDKEPNDQYIPQLIMDAEAAINFADSAGFGDRNRVGVGGHSYGGFMTANLLARTKLFKAGIARSGAYNRSLTPFGFQHEKRNYWEAKAVYDEMSPFNFADSLKTPILITHGQMDNNSGTFPIQSERLYQAISGHGGTARYLQLPYESHAYSARENVLHMLYETGAWLDKYVKNYKKESKGTQSGHPQE